MVRVILSREVIFEHRPDWSWETNLVNKEYHLTDGITLTEEALLGMFKEMEEMLCAEIR